MVIIFLLIAVLILWAWWFLSKEMSQIAEAKGYSAHRYFHICFWFGIIGFLIVVAMPDLKAHEQRKQIYELIEKNAQQECMTSPATATQSDAASAFAATTSFQLPKL